MVPVLFIAPLPSISAGAPRQKFSSGEMPRENERAKCQSHRLRRRVRQDIKRPKGAASEAKAMPEKFLPPSGPRSSAEMAWGRSPSRQRKVMRLTPLREKDRQESQPEKSAPASP